MMYKEINKNFHHRNLPPSYMEQFCKALHPDLDLSSTCLSWFRQATTHCTDLILKTKGPGSQLWTTVKNFIFPQRQTGLLNQKIPISIHPNRLTLQDCHSLFLDIVNDYIVRAPRYSAEAATNALLWQILYSLMGIMAIGSLLVSTIFAYRKFNQSLKPKEPTMQEVIFAPEKRARAYISRNMRMIRYELQRLRVRHLAQPEELFAPDGTATLVMRMSSKLNFADGIVASNVHTTGRLYRMHELACAKKPDYKTETVAKVMKFLNNYSRKLRILFIFDEDPVYEELLRKRKIKSPPKLSVSLSAAQTPQPPPSQVRSNSGNVLHPTPARLKISPRSSSPPAKIPSLLTRMAPLSGANAKLGSSTTFTGGSLTPSRTSTLTQIPRTLTRRCSSFSLKK